MPLYRLRVDIHPIDIAFIKIQSFVMKFVIAAHTDLQTVLRGYLTMVALAA